MRVSLAVCSVIGAAFAASPVIHANAAEAPYYNPSNAASSSGYTTDYQLFKTIGCPGRGLLETPCKAPEPAAKPAAAPGDADKDGVTDDKDRCPDTPAGAKVNAQGCELDSDGDGVVDRLDRCPDTPAGAKVNAQGCELDSDGDGVVDRLDQCPNTPAGRKVNAQGCELDSDGDGVVDALDQCPNTPAGDKVDNKGCSLPKTIILKGVNFENNSAVLRPEAIAVLDDSVATLKRNPGIKVEIAGHTDSANSDAYNLQLAERRAKVVMDYFVSHGVPAGSLTAKSYGESQPIADNNTATGRAENRRVELRILN